MKNTAFRAELIASLITANCESYHAGTISREKWDAEQMRLWKMAERHKAVVRRVKDIICPKFGISE